MQKNKVNYTIIYILLSLVAFSLIMYTSRSADRVTVEDSSCQKELIKYTKMLDTRRQMSIRYNKLLKKTLQMECKLKTDMVNTFKTVI